MRETEYSIRGMNLIFRYKLVNCSLLSIKVLGSIPCVFVKV
jgi:hypothetical protein